MSFDFSFFGKKTDESWEIIHNLSYFSTLRWLNRPFMSKAESTSRVRSLLQLRTSPLPMTGTCLEMHGIFWINPLNQDANSSSPPGLVYS